VLHLDPLFSSGSGRQLTALLFRITTFEISNFKRLLQNSAWGLVSLIESCTKITIEVGKRDSSPRLRFDLIDFAIRSSLASPSQICDSWVTPRPFDLFHTSGATIDSSRSAACTVVSLPPTDRCISDGRRPRRRHGESLTHRTPQSVEFSSPLRAPSSQRSVPHPFAVAFSDFLRLSAGARRDRAPSLSRRAVSLHQSATISNLLDWS